MALVDFSPCLYSNKTYKVSCGGRHSLALSAGGKLWVWGWGKYGQLGLRGDTASKLLPLAAEPCAEISDVEGGRWHTLVMGRMQFSSDLS